VMRLAEISAVLLEHQGPGPFPGCLFRKKLKKYIRRRCRGGKWSRCVEGIRYPHIGVPIKKARHPGGLSCQKRDSLLRLPFSPCTHAIPYPWPSCPPCPLLYRSALPTCCAHLSLLSPGPVPAVLWRWRANPLHDGHGQPRRQS